MQKLTDNARVVAALGRRSVKQTFRRPQLMAPIIIFPSLLLAVQTGGAGSAVNLPGFPEVNGFLDFMLAGAMIQSALLAGNSGGIAFAVDIEMGFTDRLLAAPISRFAIVLGRLAGTAALGAFAAIFYVIVGLIFGARIEEGVLGVVLMIVFVTLASIAFGGIGAAIALRSGKASVVQGLFPLVFVILFLSSAFFPLHADAGAGRDDRRVQPGLVHRRGGPRPGHLDPHRRGRMEGVRVDHRDRGPEPRSQLAGAAAPAAGWWMSDARRESMFAPLVREVCG